MADAVPVHPDAPAWFRRALDVPWDDGDVAVDGARVHYVTWGEAGRRGLVFVHGGGAHAHWWTHVAAPFAADFRVVAIDLTGHGDSDHCERYSLERWAEEVMAVADAGGVAGPPVVVGHSMGGFVTIATGSRHSDELAGVIVCDSPVVELSPEMEAYRRNQAFGPTERTYATVDEAVTRFRTLPPQEHYLDYVRDHVARRSLARGPDGWRWKFDRRVFAQLAGGVAAGFAVPYLRTLRCRFALLRSEFGLVTPDIGASMYDALGRVAPVIELPDTGHHPMLDQPLVLLTALRALLADWDHSEPRRPRDVRIHDSTEI